MADLLQQALALHQAGQWVRAQALYREILRKQPRHVDALHLSGVIEAQMGRLARAVTLMGRALALDPNNVAVLINHALALRDLGQPAAALASLGQAVALQPDWAEALYHRGMTHLQLAQPEEAMADLERAIALRPDLAEAYCGRALALRALGQLPAALVSLDAALAIRPDFAEGHCNRGLVLQELGQWQAALASCDRAIALQGNLAEAFYNRAIVLKELKRADAALASYDRAIALRPHYPEAYSNRGNLLKDLKRFDAALQSYDRAIALRGDYGEAYANRGNLLRDLMRYEEAVQSYDAALAHRARSRYVRAMRLYARAHVCDWADWDQECAALAAGIRRGEAVSHPFCVLAWSDSAVLQRQAAQIWVREECPPDPWLPPIEGRPAHERIRVGYFSADYREHAVARLTAGLFEAHDRSRFEVIGFSLGVNTGDEMRQRLECSFERFIDVRERGDPEVALLARELQVDIAVDLGGFTAEARPGIFALRAAPLQVNFLGYPGTLGTAYHDYILADRILILEADRSAYTERVVYLPDCFQPNDDRRRIAEHTPSRQECGLPDTGFVFCCFNRYYKINPPLFDLWMRLLRDVDGSVLWLSSGHEGVQRNLRRRATDRGVDPQRLVFATWLADPADHLARYRLADIFLDTLPFGAHTTASDALWAGLPVLTCAGEALASRVGASLLTAVDLPELITATLEEYAELAVRLAGNPAQLADLRQRLATRRQTSPLFDTARFARHLEDAYQQMYERYRADLPVEHIQVQPLGVAESAADRRVKSTRAPNPV